MLVSSLSTNDSFPHPHLPLDVYCFITSPSFFIVTSFQITNIFILLPLCVYILHYGLQQHRLHSSSSASLSHFDCFTYHIVTIELIGIFGCFLSCWGIFGHHLRLFYVGFYLFSFTNCGQVLFNALTCVERYLAVVHPITYLSLRNERGIKIRNISIGCSWLICFVMISLLMENYFVFVNLSILILSLITVSFCSLSILCILIRPAPGERCRGRARVDQSKQRAFYTTVVILGVLVVRFAWGIAWTVVFVSKKELNCNVLLSDVWFNLPSSLVAPLLFLHRTEKLMCCNKKHNAVRAE